MTTYVYESIPAKPGEEPRFFELKQSMKDAPLDRHPETGEPIRRVLTGGYGLLSTGKAAPEAPARAGSCCGSRCGCH